MLSFFPWVDTFPVSVTSAIFWETEGVKRAQKCHPTLSRTTMPAFENLSLAPGLHLEGSAEREQQNLSEVTVPWGREGEESSILIHTNLTLGGGQADSEVRSHVEPCKHYTLVINKVKVDRAGVCGVHWDYRARWCWFWRWGGIRSLKKLFDCRFHSSFSLYHPLSPLQFCSAKRPEA